MSLFCYKKTLLSIPQGYMTGDSRVLTHWGRVTHICVSKVTIIGSDNGLSPDRRQAIILTNAGVLLIGPFRTNFSENLIGIQTFLFKKMPLKISSAKWRPFSLGLNVWRMFFVHWYHHYNTSDYCTILHTTQRLKMGNIRYSVRIV